MSQIQSLNQNYGTSSDWNKFSQCDDSAGVRNRFSLYNSYLEDYNRLSHLEQNILTIAKSILKKKKISAELEVNQIETASPLIDELYNKCLAKLHYSQGISKEKIFTAIQILVRTKWMVSGQRRTRQEIIENPIYRNILQFIEKHPGTYSRDPAILSELHITKSPFLKHIKVLIDFDLIRKKRIGNKTTFFIKRVPETHDALVVLFQNPELIKTMLTMISMENCNISEIARRLDIYRGTIQYNVKKLLDNGVISRRENKITVNTEILSNYNQFYQSPAFF